MKMKKPKICPICSSEHYKEYAKCCSKECSNRLRKNTCLDIYGFESSAQSPLTKEKAKQTSLEKYGLISHTQSPLIKEKAKQSNLKKYGVENAMKCDEVKNKIKQTNIEKYGVPSPLQNASVLEKLKQTNIEKYGVEFVTQCDEVKNKIKSKTLENYGVDCIFKNEHIRKQIEDNRLKTKGYKNGNQFRITNYNNYNRDYILENFTTNGIVTLEHRNALVSYFNISNENNMLKILREWNIPCEKSNNYSFAEKSILKILKEKYFDFTFKENNKNLIFNPDTSRPLELDILVYKGWSILCAVEYNGTYWHDKENPLKENLKSKLCKEKGFELFHIWEDTIIEDLHDVFEYLDCFVD